MTIFGLFRNDRRTAVLEELYGRVTAAARNPALYLRLGVPDTVEGRFENLALHLVLVLRRLRRLPPPAGEIAQDLVDAFFQQLDASLREMGVGDMGVPKRMKKLARGFYDRAASYDAALDLADGAAFAEILGRNFAIMPAAALGLARYARAADQALGQAALDALIGGGATFPEPACFEEEGAA
jgi:cytochrome b pre-mRNA-processing protein 3